MNNKIENTKFPSIKIKNSKLEGKIYNSYSNFMKNDYINKDITNNTGNNEIQRIFFNINGKDYIWNNEKEITSYLYINSERRKIKLNNLRLQAETRSVDSKRNKNIGKSQYYLPVLMEKKIDRDKLSNYSNDFRIINKINTLKPQNVNRNIDLNKNVVSLHLNTISNYDNIKTSEEFKLRNKKNNFKNSNISKDKNMKKYNYLEEVRIYRKKLKDQMINRYKLQYSQHSIKKSQKEKNDLEDNVHFVFSYDKNNNNSINNVNENVKNALNIFYGKVSNKQITGYDKVFLKNTNLLIEKYILNNETKKNSNTVTNIKLNKKKNIKKFKNIKDII